NHPALPGEAAVKAVTPLRRECRCRPAELVATPPGTFSHGGQGRTQRPAFPAPSSSPARPNDEMPRAKTRRGNAKPCRRAGCLKNWIGVDHQRRNKLAVALAPTVVPDKRA